MLLEKYDICFFQEFYDADSIAMIVPYEKGKYVRADEAQERIDFLVAALESLKDCDIKLCEPAMLNDFIIKILAGYHNE